MKNLTFLILIFLVQVSLFSQTQGGATSPVITILGDNPVTITQNDTYTDAGATATDDVDGDITGLITVTGGVMTTIAGTYSVTYSVTDAAGNTAIATRTVNVVESIEVPTVSIAVSSASISEGETFTVSASIDAATSSDIVIGLASSGTAQYNLDFTSNVATRISTIAGGNGQGGNNNQLSYPRGLFVDAAGTVFIADDPWNGRIQKWTAGATEGTTIISNLNDPTDVALDAEGNIYVVEANNHRVVKYASDGTGGDVVAGGNGQGSDLDKLWNPRAIFIDKANNLYIADTENSRIVKWVSGAIEGEIVAGGNGWNGALNQLGRPTSVFVDALGNIYVTDSWSSRIMKWAPGAIQGEIAVPDQNNGNFIDISVDASGAIYVLDMQNNSVKKFLPGATTGVSVAGGTRGSNANQLTDPQGLFVDGVGNIYISDTENRRVQKYDVTPQIVITAGETQGSLLFSGKRDTSDEEDETIVLNATVGSNATLASTDPLTLSLLDINPPPSVVFTFSEEKIKEVSSTDVTLTARLSSISGKEVVIDFTLGGTAVLDTDYTLSSQRITIPAGAITGTLTVSTATIPADGLVEVLDTIIFTVSEITNATAPVYEATLYLESIEAPTVSLATSATSISEGETFTVTANIEAATSTDVVIDLTSSGTAKYNVDFTSDVATRISTIAGGNGQGGDNNQLNYPRGLFVDAAGTTFIADQWEGRIQKWELGATEGTTIINNLREPTDVALDALGNIYVVEKDNHKVVKYAADGSNGQIVAGGNGDGSNVNQLSQPQGIFIDNDNNLYIADSNNSRIMKWAPDATEGEVVAGGNGEGDALNQFYRPMSVYVDNQENIYVVDEWRSRIMKWAPGAIQGEIAVPDQNNGNFRDISVDASGAIYVLDMDNNSVKKFLPGAASGSVVAGGTSGSNENQLRRPLGLFIDSVGNMYVSDSDNRRVQKYDSTPQIVIAAGETSGSLLFSGLRDTSNEEEETIVLNTTVGNNATLASTDPLTLSLLDINDPPTVAFAFSDETIKEASTTDVKLTATLSSISGIEVVIDFTLDGTAVLDTDYTLSSQRITIPAGSNKGELMVSTATIEEDGEVEVLDTIIFTVSEITNATAPVNEATLYLESIEKPTVSVATSATSVSEGETFTVTANLEAATSTDVVIDLPSSGTAKYNVDFTSDVATRISTVAGGNGEGSDPNQLRYPRGLFVDAAGTIFIADPQERRIQKWELGATEGITIISNLNNPVDVALDASGNIYVVEENDHRVVKYAADGSGGQIVAGGNGNGSDVNQLSQPQGIFIDNDNNLYIADRENSRIMKWAPDATEGEVVAGGNGEGDASNQLNRPRSVYVDNLDNIYVVDEWRTRIMKWAPGAIQGEIAVPDQNNGNFSDISVDASGAIYVLDGNNHSIKKFLPGAASGSVVAGGTRGSNENQLNEPRGLFVDSVGNMYVSDSNNRRVQKYEVTPQIVIAAGKTSGSLLFSVLEDTKDEVEELITLTAIQSENALLDEAESVLEISLVNTTLPPTVELEFNQDKITETSSTDVILTATLSSISGKEVVIDFTLGGTANLLADYTVSSQSITIPAGTSKGELTVSTATIPADGVVEVLDTIVFTVSEITNATAPVDEVTLYLESNENPQVSLSVSKETIAEHETFNVIATLDAPTSKEVVIALESIGTAEYNLDFIRNSAIEIKTVAGGNGYGSNNNQVARPQGTFVDNLGNLYIVDNANGRIQKWLSGAKEGQTVLTDLWDPRDVFVDSDNFMYWLDGDGRSVWKIAANDSNLNNRVNVAGEGYNLGEAPNQLSGAQSFIVDSEGNIYVADTQNHRIMKWAPDATEGEVVAGGKGGGNALNQLHYPRAVALDLEGNVLVLDSNNRRVQKWTSGATEGETIITYNTDSTDEYPLDMQLDAKGNILVLLDGYNYNTNENYYQIKSYNSNSYEPTTIIDANGGSEIAELNSPERITIDALGNIYVSDVGNRRIQKFELSLQVKVKPGDTEGTLSVAGVEDELNEEGTELIQLKSTQASNADLADIYQLEVNLLDNTKTMVLRESPFLGLSEGAVSWGDYDKDGDQDVAVMGKSGSLGAVTKLYKNNNGVFEDTQQNLINLFGGDITWVDLNKDGYIDIVVSGYDGNARTPVTKVYLNEFFGSENVFIEPEEGYELPQLFSTKMAWGDLDNDGDIDLAIAGQDADNAFVFDVYFKEDSTNNYVKDTDFSNQHQGFINGDLKIVDVDLDGDNDIVYSGENDNGDAVGGTIYNSYIKDENNYYDYSNSDLRLKNSAIEVAKLTAETNTVSVISSGVNESGELQLSGIYGNFPILKKGDISVADFDNDGKNDILFTGEDELGVPTTKLFKQTSAGTFKDSEIVLKGLRASTANWVDYDTDGDLDLFLTGIGEAGSETLLYETEIANKKNSAPEKITGLEAVDLGNGNVRFQWDLPEDDYSTNLGYVLRLGTTPGGTELSNTESDLETGDRLITKAPPIYTNFYEIQLDPGNYYWSVQAVDTGLEGGVFSDEDVFQLVYEWKILNQGGIVDRTVNGVSDPVLKLADIDNDNDLDVIFSSKSGNNTQLLKYDGTKLILDNQNPLSNTYNVTNTEVSDINGDGIADILVNTVNNSNSDLTIYLSNNENIEIPTGNYSSQRVGDGLFNAKARIVDLNNDGKAEIFLAGMSSNSINAEPKLYVYEYNNNSFAINDVSSQIASLQNASYDLGDYDNDQDIDFIISGWSFGSGYQSYIYENITELGGEFTLNQTSNNLVAVQNGTTNFIDFDGDGDLDALFTGESREGDVFEIYINTLRNGSATFSRLPNDLAPMREGKIDLGDFNGDGYADLLYSGTFQGDGDETKLNEYDPITKQYVDSAFDVSDIIKAEVEFGDLDGDGDLDFVIAGKKTEDEDNQFGNSNNQNIFRTYLNVRNQSARVLENSNGNKRPKYAGKNTAKYVQKESFTVNTPPDAPILKDIKFLSEIDNSAEIPVEFEWNAATDDHTPSEGLTYAIKIGTTPGGEEIMSSNSNSNGIKKDAEKGNVEHNLKWKLSLPEGTYYYSVQAVDASYSGSAFTAPVQFKVTASGIDSDTDSDGIENSLDLCPNTPAGAAVDTNGCEVNAILGDANGNTEVTTQDLVVAINYILGKNPIPFVFKATDVNNDESIDVIDIVGIVDLILNADLQSKTKEDSYYSNTPIGDAIFSWEGNDLYVSSENAIAGMQLVFDNDFTFKLSDELVDFSYKNFTSNDDNSLIIYSFNETAIRSGKIKLLTKFHNNPVVLDANKSAVAALKGLTLNALFKPNVSDQLEILTLGPNPSNGQMNLFYNLTQEVDELLLKVYNLNGSQVWSSKKIKNVLGKQKTFIDISFLSQGVYFMRIEKYNNKTILDSEVKRLIIKK